MAQPFSQSKAYRDLNLFTLTDLTETQARERFALMRWGSLTEMPCPDCGVIDKHYVRKRRNQWRCKHCERVFSVTTGTPFANRKLPFRKLLILIYEFVSSPKGCSANALHARLGITCRTAFHNLGKLREVLFEQMDLTPLKGTVQIDGCHVCGKPRRPRRRRKTSSFAINNKLRNRKAGMNPDRSAFSEPWNIEKLKKRRIVLVLREVAPTVGRGSVRTIARVVRAETAKEVLPLIKRYVDRSSKIQTDDGYAYSNLTAWFEHETVCHSTEYCTDSGVSNNQAESFFGRLRRAEYGTFHGMRPQYLAFYVAEIAWREDERRTSLAEKFRIVINKVFASSLSNAWRGYFQGRRLGFEYLG